MCDYQLIALKRYGTAYGLQFTKTIFRQTSCSHQSLYYTVHTHIHLKSSVRSFLYICHVELLLRLPSLGIGMHLNSPQRTFGGMTDPILLCTYQCYAPLPPTRAMVGNRWGFEFCKVQMHHLLGMPVGQIPTFAPLKN